MTRSPALPTTAILASQVTDDARQFGGGIGMRETAADGAAIADLIMRNVLHRRDQKRMRVPQLRMFENVAPAHHGAEDHAIAGDLDLPQFRRVCADRR